ncbi:TPA: hypothetical protein ACG0T3_004092 [Citrobacter farmeri]
MTTITREQAQKIIDAADEVITALAGTNDDVHPDNSSKMCALWDDLNDRYAPPEVVRELARIALASLEAEPVAWTDADELRDAKNGGNGYLFAIGGNANKFADPRRQMMLYAAPPAPVVLPSFDEWLTSTGRKPVAWVREVMEESYNACRAAMLQGQPVSNRDELLPSIKPAPELDSVDKNAELLPGNSPVIPDCSEDTKRLDWLDYQNKRLNEYYGTAYGWKFDANFQRNAMMLNDSNYPVMTVRQAIDQAIASAPQQEVKPVQKK